MLAWRKTEIGQTFRVVVGPAAGVREDQHALARRAQGADAIARFGEHRLAFVQGTPLVEEDVVEAIGNLAEARDRCGGEGAHDGPPCSASKAVPKLASVSSATLTCRPRVRWRIAVQAALRAPPPMLMTRCKAGAPRSLSL